MVIDERFIKQHTGLDVKAVVSATSTFDEIGKHDVFIALTQTNGEGRGEHTFFCPAGGIYMVMRVTGMYIDPHTLTPAVGLAVHDTIYSMLGIRTELKWVNDIYYNDKKVVGILCKSPRKAEYLIGIGVNYCTRQSEFVAAGLDDTACSLDAPPQRATAFVTGLINRIRRATLATFDHIRYSNLCRTVGKTVSFIYDGKPVQGFAQEVAPDGSLIVRIGSATVAVDAGEVSVLRDAH